MRSDERELLRFVRNRGPMTLRQLNRQYPADRKDRARNLDDLARFGLVALYENSRGWTVVHSTPKAEPLADWQGPSEWNESCARLVPKELVTG